MLRRSITVREADVEAVLDVLLPLIPSGVHDRPAGAELVELAWYGDHAVPDLGDRVVGFGSEEAPDDLAERRRAYRGAVIVAGAVAIRGPTDPPAPPGLAEVVVESGHGEFGTGSHPTTRACLEILLHLDPGGSFADLGCGAGTLAVVAARMGYSPVVAIDFEAPSVEVTRRNAARNGVEVEAYEGDLLELPPPPAATVAANVPLAVHRAIAPRLGAETTRLILSGVVSEDADEAVELYRAAGLVEAGRGEAADWATVLMGRQA